MTIIKGYFVPAGFMGWVVDSKHPSGNYILFASESDYLEFIEGDENE